MFKQLACAVALSLAGCRTTYEQVQLNKATPQEFFSDAYKDCKDKAAVKGYLFDPSDEELEARLKECLPGDLADLIPRAKESYKEGGMATIIPAVLPVFGMKGPVYVVVKKNFLDELVIGPDAESAILHENQHGTDWHNGIEIGGVYLSAHTPIKDIRPSFIQDLMEFRADYAQLEDAFRKSVKAGQLPISAACFSSMAQCYYEHWLVMEYFPASEVEAKVIKAQFEEFKGIRPEGEPGGLMLYFDLFGKKDKAHFTRKKQ